MNMIDHMGRSSNCLLKIISFGLLLLVLFSFQHGYTAPKTVDKTEFQEYSMMGHIVLCDEISFAEQLKQSNTIYEIRYSFNLENKKITIPEGSVLLMMGGSISNGILEGTRTNIVYVDGLFNCQLSGSFTNENIHMEWFGIKSGEECSDNNDRLLRSYVVPSMERIGNTLYMNPETVMYFNTPIVFNGTYNLDIRGKLRYNGALISTAVSIGTPQSRIYEKKYYINSVVSTNSKLFFNDGEIVENIGVCLWNLKHCNITLGEVKNFSYCIRLCGNIGGCSSNIINYTLVGGSCFYGIHCLSYDKGWVNENTFYGKVFGNFSDNPAKDKMCAIWFEARDKNTCNANVFYDPCVEGCQIVAKYTNALYNIVHDARTERIGKAIVTDDKSKNNTLYCKYWDEYGDYQSFGSNRVIKQSELLPPYPYVFSEQLGLNDTNHFGICIKDGKLRVQGDVNGGLIFGKIVEVVDSNKDVNIEYVFEQPGRYAIVFLNDDYTVKDVKNLDDYKIRSDVTASVINGGFRCSHDVRRGCVNLPGKSGKMLVGAYCGSRFGDVLSMSVYSDNLIVDDLYCSNNGIFTLNKNVSIDAFYYSKPSQNFLSDSETIQLNGILNLKKKTLFISNKDIFIGRGGGLENGILDVSGCAIYPNYNSLIDNKNLKVTGMPAAGTYYFQKGRPTWSNGSSWIDSSGNVIH